MFSTPNLSLSLSLSPAGAFGWKSFPCIDRRVTLALWLNTQTRAESEIVQRREKQRPPPDLRTGPRRPPSGFKDIVSLVGSWHGRVGWQNRGFVRTSFTVPSGARLGAAVQHFSPIANPNDAQ
ncbi:hypothetical protein CSHISOI_09275 [Colletotrichum shisoi]|uniref:Uncharacterized protein n=1 Tax=Colletotrichum shisoi TaxID=2078593 RepID=A0A5Q4BH98_9PEZI|nr:hypothetical protein CSHISOI_09275 [Colletotrichum shisoi]